MSNKEKNLIKVNSINFTNGGIVIIKLIDDRKFKLYSKNWFDLNYTHEKYLSLLQIERLEFESNYTMIKEKILNLLDKREHSAMELRIKLKKSFDLKLPKFTFLYLKI